MLYRLACYLLAKWKFRDYIPQPITFATVNAWIEQFGSSDAKYLLTLLRHVTYITDENTLRALRALNRELLKKLAADGIPAAKVIYVQLDDAGSSSHWVLAVLKHAERLDNLGCTFLDSKNVRDLSEITARLQEGAIIYVDDFAGSGNQFCRSRDFAIDYAVGNFVEFFLLPCICEEAVEQLDERGVEPRALFVHKKEDRLLRPEADFCPSDVKERLVKLSSQINQNYPLGYKNLGSMVVLARNCPNSAPLVLRGSKNQTPYIGILPRTTDLPPVSHYGS